MHRPSPHSRNRHQQILIVVIPKAQTTRANLLGFYSIADQRNNLPKRLNPLIQMPVRQKQQLPRNTPRSLRQFIPPQHPPGHQVCRPLGLNLINLRMQRRPIFSSLQRNNRPRAIRKNHQRNQIILPKITQNHLRRYLRLIQRIPVHRSAIINHQPKSKRLISPAILLLRTKRNR